MYGRGSWGNTVSSQEVIRWKVRAANALQQSAPLVVMVGPLRVTTNLYRPIKRGDIDNYNKVVHDFLNGRAWIDDDQIVETHTYRHDDRLNPRIELLIEAV